MNGRVYATVFDGATRTLTTTTPAGRRATATVDAQGRLTEVQRGTLAPVSFVYSARGLLSTVTQASRTLGYAYSGAGELAEIFREEAAWLDRVDVMVVELHDRLVPGCAEALNQALCGRRFRQEIVGANLAFDFR